MMALNGQKRTNTRLRNIKKHRKKLYIILLLRITKMLDKNKEPFLLFDEWFDLAQLKELNDPNAMNLATVSEDNKPHSRKVLLKVH